VSADFVEAILVLDGLQQNQKDFIGSRRVSKPVVGKCDQDPLASSNKLGTSSSRMRQLKPNSHKRYMIDKTYHPRPRFDYGVFCDSVRDIKGISMCFEYGSYVSDLTLVMLTPIIVAQNKQDRSAVSLIQNNLPERRAACRTRGAQ
jgi:hypothetical protein